MKHSVFVRCCRHPPHHITITIDIIIFNFPISRTQIIHQNWEHAALFALRLPLSVNFLWIIRLFCPPSLSLCLSLSLSLHPGICIISNLSFWGWKLHPTTFDVARKWCVDVFIKKIWISDYWIDLHKQMVFSCISAPNEEREPNREKRPRKRKKKWQKWNNCSLVSIVGKFCAFSSNKGNSKSIKICMKYIWRLWSDINGGSWTNRNVHNHNENENREADGRKVLSSQTVLLLKHLYIN